MTAFDLEQDLENGGAMHLVVYISRYTGGRNEIDSALSSIASTSIINNGKSGITGLLFYHEGHFLQLIEGRRKDVENLMERLERDTRHCDIHRMVDEGINERSFKGWRVDSFNLNYFDKLDLDSLQTILDVYKRNYTMDSEDLILFFKLALESHTSLAPVSSRAYQREN